jgi:hypothetical protein
MSYFSPDVDLLIENARRYRGAESTSPEVLGRVRACHALLERIEPVQAGPDSIWSLWITTARGRLEDFGDYEDYREAGEVESREEFEELWRYEYPDEVQWWRLGIVRYEGRLFFRLGGKLEFDVDLESGKFSAIDVAQDDCRRLVLWLLDAIDGEVRCLLSDPQAYNRELERRLPLSRRFGRIRRRDLWEVSTQVDRLDEELGAEDLELLGRIVREMDDAAAVKEMTLANYLSVCAICYQANAYRHLEPGMTPREMYRAMADNRDAGLLEILPDDPAAFARWYRERHLGGHPWEICRGGNRTHISLHVTPRDVGWQLRLAGFSTSRAVETARMAIALSERAVPFVLEQRQEMLRMLTGEDFLGIVPADVPLGYNRGDFPEEDRIYSFVHLYMIEDACGSLPDSIVWYPLKKLRIRNEEERL